MCDNCEEHKKDKKEDSCCSEKEKEECCSKEKTECCDKEMPSAEELVEEVKKEDEQEEAEEAKEVQYPAEEQGIEPEKDSDEIKEEMEQGERSEDVYTEEGREKLVEDGEINPEEAGFMEGASGGGQLGKDALTGEPLMDVEDVVEAEIDGQMYRFVNEENAQEFRKKREKE
jgi:hypothetical protein